MKLAPSPAADDSDTLLVAEEIIAVPDSALINQAIAQAQQVPKQSTQVAPATEPQPAKPERQEVQEPQPAPVVTAPAASVHTETAMIAAYTDDGRYRAYTVSDWDGFTADQKAKLQPVGVQLTAKGQQFIVAPTDAAGGQEVKWEDKDKWQDCVDIPGLDNIESDAEAKRDFNGQSNTKKILAYGKENGISFPAVEAAHNYSVKGHCIGWYLPANGQWNLILDNKLSINKVLKQIGGVIIDDWYWSSTEISSGHSWSVGIEPIGNFVTPFEKIGGTLRVRAVALVPVSSPELPSSAK